MEIGRLRVVSHFGKSVAWLDRPFSKDKVRATVFLLNKEKALGPNGLLLQCIKNVGM